MDVDFEACINGDAEAWRAFCDQTVRLVVASIRRVIPSGNTPSGDELDDLVQSVYIKLLRNDRRLLRNYDPARAGISTWITLIARSVAIDALRRKKLDLRPLDEAAGAVSSPQMQASVGPLVPTHILTSRQKLVLTMLFEDGMDIADVAIVLDVNPQTIRSTKHKAIDRLRAYFRAHPFGDGGTPDDVEIKDRP
ncbi:MAG: sigma-70 family RNA polymerase sigma factor [Phycisphaerales bacterium]|nr:sigma-70 family RNA polymerase sigma factor [Phycisphaerales bacterium]